MYKFKIYSNAVPYCQIYFLKFSYYWYCRSLRRFAWNQAKKRRYPERAANDVDLGICRSSSRFLKYASLRREADESKSAFGSS